MASVATTDVTVAAIDEMDPIHGGIARRARAQLGVTSWGMQVLTLPPNWQDYPNHNHDDDRLRPEPGGGLHPARRICDARRRRGAIRARARIDGARRAPAAPPDRARAGRDPVDRAGRPAGDLRRTLLDRARRAAAGRGVASGHGAADRRRGRRRAGFRGVDGSASPAAARSLLPHARIGPRRRRCAPGDDAEGVARDRPVRAARRAVVLALSHRDQRLSPHDRAAQPRRGSSGRRVPAALPGRAARGANAARRGGTARDDRSRLRRPRCSSCRRGKGRR